MNKRCVVNVATGDFYCKMQERLRQSLGGSIDFMRSSVDGFQKHDLMRGGIRGIDLLLWIDEFPKGSRSHEESPYGFKVHAIKAAYEKGYTSILWLDSPAMAVKDDISPIFDKIEKEGYYAMSHIDPLENWVGDTALRYYAYRDEDLIGKNLPSGSCYGFDLSSRIGELLFNNLFEHEGKDKFKSEAIGEGKWHRHDEAMLALILIEFDRQVFTFDPLFQSDSPECVIRSGTAWVEDAKVYGDKYNK